MHDHEYLSQAATCYDHLQQCYDYFPVPRRPPPSPCIGYIRAVNCGRRWLVMCLIPLSYLLRAWTIACGGALRPAPSIAAMSQKRWPITGAFAADVCVCGVKSAHILTAANGVEWRLIET